MTDDWMDDELIGILEGKKRPKRRWWAVAARPIPPGTQTGPVPPLDSLPTATGAYSFRKLRTAYVANLCMRVIRASDSAQQDIGFDASGNFDIVGFSAFIGGSSGSCILWYDQSGTAYNLSYTILAPPINLTALNGKPGLIFTGGSQDMSNLGTPSFSQPYTLNCVGNRTGTVATAGLWGDVSQNSGIYPYVTSGTATIYAGTLSATVPCTNNVMHIFTGTFNGASSTLTIDGATTSGLSVGAGGVTGLRMGNVGTNPLTGTGSEAMAWNSILSAANIAALGANQKAYWGTP